MQPTTPASHGRSIRHFFQFGLKSIMLITVICAVALTWWRQRGLIEKLEATREELETCKDELEFQQTVNRIFDVINVDKPKHRELLRVVQRFTGGPLFRLFGSFEKRSVGFPIGDLPFEVVVLHHDSMSIPGGVISVAVLLQDREVVDFVVRDVSTREGSHQPHLEDADNDGKLDFVIDCHPGIWSPPGAKPHTIGYAITSDGFVEMTRPPRPFREFGPAELP
jgi:hypothetical protein